MTSIVCSSKFISDELESLISCYDDTVCKYSENRDDSGATCVEKNNENIPHEWLSSLLKKNTVDFVFFDPHYFIDTGEYRKLSPKTQFIVITPMYEEDVAEKAFRFGAVDICLLPVTKDTVSSIYA